MDITEALKVKGFHRVRFRDDEMAEYIAGDESEQMVMIVSEDISLGAALTTPHRYSEWVGGFAYILPDGSIHKDKRVLGNVEEDMELIELRPA